MKRATLILSMGITLFFINCDSSMRKEEGPKPAEEALPAADLGENPSPAQDSGADSDGRMIFQTPELGLLVKAPIDTVIVNWQEPEVDWHEEGQITKALATAGFRRPNGNTYYLRVLERKPGETFAEWTERSVYADSFCSSQSIGTLNGKIAGIYDTTDYGGLPDIHALILVWDKVYRFHYETPGLPHDPEEALSFMGNDRSRQDELFTVPEDFLQFLQEIEVAN